MRKELEQIINNRLFSLHGKPIPDHEKGIQYQLEKVSFEGNKLVLHVFMVKESGGVDYFDTSIDAANMHELMSQLLIHFLKSDHGLIFHSVHKELDTISRNIY